MNGQPHNHFALAHQENSPRVPTDVRPGGPQSRPGYCEVKKFLDLTLNRPLGIQPVARHYADWAIPCNYNNAILNNNENNSKNYVVYLKRDSHETQSLKIGSNSATLFHKIVCI
jgi:hypothetical protein